MAHSTSKYIQKILRNIQKLYEEQQDIPELFRVKIKKKNYFKPEIIVKDKRREIMDTVLVFEEARAYRKAYGNYLRPNAWDDLHVKVYA